MTALAVRRCASFFSAVSKSNLNTKVLAPVLNNIVISRNYAATEPASQHSKLYELRNYSIHPQYLKPFLDLTVEWIHIRTNHSKLIGYWLSELGGLNQVIHIWEYDNLSQRANVRRNLASDKDWGEKYFSKILPMMDKQDNSTMLLFPWSSLRSDLPAGGVYELQSFRHTGSDGSAWGPVLNNYISARSQLVTSVGSFQTTLAGPRNSSVHVWHYPSFDVLETSHLECVRDENISSKYSVLMKNVSEENVKVMVPLPFSPLK